MQVPKIAIQNNQFVFILLLLILILGIQSYIDMPRTENVSIKFPEYGVNIIYAGASPSDLEKLVVNPLEEAIESIDDIEQISSSMSEGFASIYVRGATHVDVKDSQP